MIKCDMKYPNSKEIALGDKVTVLHEDATTATGEVAALGDNWLAVQTEKHLLPYVSPARVMLTADIPAS